VAKANHHRAEKRRKKRESVDAVTDPDDPATDVPF
jgi:hypothetical protein